MTYHDFYDLKVATCLYGEINFEINFDRLFDNYSLLGYLIISIFSWRQIKHV